MSTLIPNVLFGARNLFRRFGIRPPLCLSQLGRRLLNALSASPQSSAVTITAPDGRPFASLEAKIDHLIWQNERIEATLYLQSLQAPLRPAPAPQAGQPTRADEAASARLEADLPS